MFNNILIVCTGNICRSPMAEVFLRAALTQSGKTGHTVSSAGLGALPGHQADPAVHQLMAETGLDISTHRARQITDDMIHRADIILVMETWQKTAIEARTPSAKGKVFRLGEWEKIDISDPYKKNLCAFKHAMMLIEQGVSQWVAKL
ncbi:low molecular weight phosphotyrosine protein phosphatase [Nitrosomonas sp. HPC101]|nr:low molecular weight protein-tyrosine-phosphatase [Nitrosomonas sp. HPC101]MXS85114.1 low molecular weight phosphotyrosine protein phosphatase [Nitrosomonas sp. HPC101]